MEHWFVSEKCTFVTFCCDELVNEIHPGGTYESLKVTPPTDGQFQAIKYSGRHPRLTIIVLSISML